MAAPLKSPLAAMAPPPPSPAPPVADEPGATGIPFMITADMKTRLREIGYTDAQIADMRPAEAHRLLDAPSPTHVVEAISALCDMVEGLAPADVVAAMNEIELLGLRGDAQLASAWLGAVEVLAGTAIKTGRP